MIGSPLGSLPLGRLVLRSEIEREINREILMVKFFVFLASPSGISTDWEIRGYIAREFSVISIGCYIDREILGLIGISRD